MSGENIVAAILGGVVGGTAGYKSGYAAGYRKKEEEDRWVIGSLQNQLANANVNAQTLQKEVERLKNENESLRSEKSILHRVKGALTA